MTEPEPHTISRTDWLLLGLLLALILPLRVWLICNTEVAARDSVGYIRYALHFEQYTWKEVLLKHHQHPGYPAMIWLVSQPIRAIDGETTPENMELSAQLVSLIASLLLILPMYFLGRQFFDRTTCFWGVLLYQYLPISAQHLSDGISEPTYLLLMISALLQAVHAVRERTVWRCQLCGLFTGLAYLTRPEGALILPALVIVLVAMQFLPAWRCSWQRFVECGASAVTTAALVGAIYVGATGKITNKPAPLVVMHIEQMSSVQSSAHLFAATFPRADSETSQVLLSAKAVFAEIVQGFHYGAVVPLLLGMYWSFFKLRHEPGYWFTIIYFAIHGCILVALGRAACYVSDRHVMVLVLGGSFYAVEGMREAPRRILGWLKIDAAPGWRPWHRSASVWFAIAVLTMFLFSLPKAVHRLHANRAGNHAAGYWLHDQFKVGDLVVDDHAWTHYFAGLVFTEGDEPKLQPDYVPTCYIVATRSRDPEVNLKRHADFVASDAKIVYCWPENTDKDKARVLIYAQPRDFKKQPWRKLPN